MWDAPVHYDLAFLIEREGQGRSDDHLYTVSILSTRTGGAPARGSKRWTRHH